ncbi:hypothetical protein [Paenisporosarcina sp. TG20]|uniref:hypothetical protein n=1 Tax=Paenisporosarcina sp. TG20 TaxID=1211706 RepID=UPI0002E5EE2F|nr:hypothetical protein [Paenisporosarcina sp. TG20]
MEKILEGNYDWVPIVGALISLVAVFVAIVAVVFQFKQFKKIREPIIAPAMRNFDLELPETHLDWDTGEKLDDKFSETTIPIYNYGGTTAINIMYSYKCINLAEVKESLDNIKLHKDNVIKIDSIDKKVKDSFDLYFSNENEKTSNFRRFHNIRSYIKSKDLIQPGESIDIFLPSYFIVIINYAFRLSRLEDIKLPKLQLKMRYKDVNYQDWEMKYIIQMGGSFNYKRNRLESSFVSEFVSKKRINWKIENAKVKISNAIQHILTLLKRLKKKMLSLFTK